METQFLIQNLPDVLDPNLDLLNGLLSKQVLTDRQYFLICSKTNIYEKNDELVGYLSKYTGDFDKVLKIIEDNGQQHVANFIRSSGEYSSEYGDFWPLQSERKFIIRENLTQLADLLDVDDNLIGDLVSRGCFTDQQLAGVVNSADHNERNTKLLHVFMRSSVNNLNVLLEYLKASQPHVVPLLTGNKELWNSGNRKTSPLDEPLRKRIQANQRDLIDLIDLDGGLLGELCARGCINQTQRLTIEQQQLSPLQNNRKLLEIVSRRSLADFDVFVDCLKATGQQHIAHLLTNDKELLDCESPAMQPLDKVLRKRLELKQTDLIRFIDLDIELVARLRSEGCINDMHRIVIEQRHLCPFERNRKLLEIISRKSRADFDSFIRSLVANGQSQVVHLLTEDAVIAAVHAELQLQSPGGADVTESKIVSQSEVRLCIECDEPQNLQTKKLLAEINGKLAELNVDPNKLILRKGNSILCCFICSSEEQLQQLRYLYESGAMKRVLEDVFTVLSDDDESIAIRELRWNLEEYNDSVQRLNLLKALGIVEIVDGFPVGKLNSNTNVIRMTDLHHELREMIVIKAVVELYAFHRVRRLLPRADVLSLVTVCSVSCDWMTIITRRRYNRRQLRQRLHTKSLPLCLELTKAVVMLRKSLTGSTYQEARNADAEVLLTMAAVCRHWSRTLATSDRRSRRIIARTFHEMPQLRDVKRLGVDASREVVGMTSLGDDRLFVLFSPNRKQIEIYDATAFKLQQTLRVKALGDRNDTSIYNGLTACVDNNCLYISDYNRSLVHKVQLSSDNSIFLFQVSGYPTGGLSVNAMHNILVTSWTVSSGNNLYEYTPVGTLIREIKLEFDFTLRLWHAIELTTDQFVACVGHNRGSLPDYVVELDGRGQVGVNYEGQLRTTRKQQFWWPCHLAVDGNKERIFVADRENNRIVMLNRSAKCAHELTASPDGDQMMAKPQCVYLDESLSRLLVGVEDGRVFVFNARRYKC